MIIIGAAALERYPDEVEKRNCVFYELSEEKFENYEDVESLAVLTSIHQKINIRLFALTTNVSKYRKLCFTELIRQVGEAWMPLQR